MKRFVGLLARRPDAVALVAVLLIACAAWLYLVQTPGMTRSMYGMDMSWAWKEGLLLFSMWAVMMVAMMLPSTAPMILLVSRMESARAAQGSRYTPVAFFAIGYLIVWWGFSAIAALAQWGLHSAAILSPEIRAASPLAGAVVLTAAGIYQWLPVKQRCLRHCRSPFGFLTTSWREGRLGALKMGITHGAFCVGCCWMLMALLFVVGVMNLTWVAALSGIVLLEKVFPAGPVIARVAGIVFIAAGIALMI